MKKAIFFTLSVCMACLAHSQSKTDTTRDFRKMKPAINNGVKITAVPQTVISTPALPSKKQTATGIIYQVPTQGKDALIEITAVEDISSGTMNKYKVHYKIVNGGSENFHTGYTRVRSNFYTTAGVRIPTGGDTCVVPVQSNLSPGSSVEWAATVFSPFLYNNNSYTITLTVDARNELAEANESNNTVQKIVAAHLPTPVTGTVADIDGNIYHSIKIGTQVWMLENLKTTRLNDGTALVNPKQVLISNNNFGQSPAIVGNGWGISLLSGVGGSYVLKANNPAYCYYNDDAGNNATFGKLYNWYAVSTGKLAPAGWHVATEADWVALEQYLTGIGNIDGCLRSISGWNTSNSSNSTGFTALPAGCIYESNNVYKFGYMGSIARFWSAGTTPKGREIQRNIYGSISGMSPLNGYSVRCVKDMP